MPDDVKIPITTPGAQAAKRRLEEVARAEGKLGKEGKEATEKTTKGAKGATSRMRELAGSVGGTVAAFASFGAAAGIAISSVVSYIKSMLDYLKQTRGELRETYKEFVDFTRQPGTMQLAQIRGATEAETARWMLKTARTYAIAPEEARAAAFEIESGLMPQEVGGPAALAEIQTAAFQTMRATAARGATVAGIILGAKGVARTPGDVRQFLAKTTAYAAVSRMSLEGFGQIIGRRLPQAISAGIDPEEFLSIAAAMSMRIVDPALLGTYLERMIRAAGTKGPELEQLAQEGGMELARMSTMEIINLQSSLIARAGGPQAATRMAERLGLTGEMAAMYMAAYDPAVQREAVEKRKAVAGATWGRVIGERYAEVRGRPESELYAAQMETRAARYAGGAAGAQIAIIKERVDAQIADMKARGVFLTEWEQEVEKNRLLSVAYMPALYAAYEDETVDPDVRKAISGILSFVQMARPAEGGRPTPYIRETALYGAETLLQRANVIIYEGGTHYHNDERRDPAARPVEPANQHQ